MNYGSMKIAELRDIAAEKGIRNTEGMKKKELVELLLNVDLMMSKKAETAEPAKETADEDPGKAAEGQKKPAAEKSKRQGADNVRKPARNEAGRPAQDEARKNSQDESRRPVPDEGRKLSQDDERRSVPDEVRKPVQDTAGKSEAVGTRNAAAEEAKQTPEQKPAAGEEGSDYNADLDSGSRANGILEVMSEGFGFIRSDNYMPGERDIYVSPAQIRRFNLKTGDIVTGPIRRKVLPNEKFQALLFIEAVNGQDPETVAKRKAFESLTPIFPEDRIRLDYTGAPISLRIVDFFSPIGKGQRGMIVSPPKAGKTTLLKQIAKRISVAYPEIHLLVLLIDERPEEVTDIKESIVAANAEVIYSTFDELPEHHKRVSEMVIERAKRMVEAGKDVVILLDSLTRLARAYNLTVTPSGRTLSGGLDPAALHMPKKFFGAARNMREGGSLTILATALVETGSRMDDVVFEEFKGTGNMELVLNRNLSEKRVFPAIDIAKSGTRRDDLLLSQEESEILGLLHSQMRGSRVDEATEEIIKAFGRTRNNLEFMDMARKLFGRNLR